MTPYYADDWLTVFHGDCQAAMAEMEPESVHCVVTSPPYWGLRDYGTATWEGGDASCDHTSIRRPGEADKSYTNGGTSRDKPTTACRRCGATRIDAQLGLEPTPEEYVANLVAVFREVRRVLRKDGTVWLNLGDSFWNHSPVRTSSAGAFETTFTGGKISDGPTARRRANGHATLKMKDLVGIPWRVALALQQPYYTGTIPDERDRTWLAALMDGEGTFTILSTTSPHGSGNSYPPIAQVRMTSQGVVQKAASLVGVASPAQYPPSATGNRGVYQWRLAGRRAADIARELYPYLIEKRKQALVAWNHQEVRDGYTTKRGVTIPGEALAKQLVCRDLIRRLNRAEHVDTPSWMVEPPSLLEPGWYLRSDVIWAKPNPMPESVTDRPTKSHEYLFLLSKSARYYFDANAVREPSEPWAANHPDSWATGMDGGHDTVRWSQREPGGPTAGNGDIRSGRNIRSVWTVATAPYPGAHFATFPPKLIEPCIKAGTSERGVCPECGAPWEREVEHSPGDSEAQTRPKRTAGMASRTSTLSLSGNGSAEWAKRGGRTETTGWRPSCAHISPFPPRPAIVLDPFAGSGTTGLVAQSLSRRAVLIDLSLDYLGQLMGRNADIPLGLGA